MRVLLVANPNAGSRRRRPALGQIARLLQEAGVRVREAPAAGPGQPAAAVRQALQDESPHEMRVVAAGGDGTLNALLPALMGTPFPLAVLPSGTLNALAGELGIPRDLDEAIAVAMTGRPRRIDLGLMNGRPFAQMAGVGFDGAVVHSVVPSANKRMLGLSALARGLRLLATYAPTTVRIATESALIETEAWLVLVANAGHYTYTLRVAPGAAVDDGWLDVWVFRSSPTTMVLGQVMGLLSGQPHHCRGVLWLKTRRLHIDSDPPALVHVDGDAAGHTPVDIGVVPKAISVIAPVGRAAPPGGRCQRRPVLGGRS